MHNPTRRQSNPPTASADPASGKRRHVRGKRAGRTHRATSWQRSVERDSERFDVHNSTSHEVVNGKANKRGETSSPAMNVNTFTDETVESHLIPRRSLTSKQQLASKRIPLEGILLKGSLPEVVDGKFTGRMIESSDASRVLITEYSPKTLLVTAKAVKPIEQEIIKRQTSRSKRIRFDEDHVFPQYQSKTAVPATPRLRKILK